MAAPTASGSATTTGETRRGAAGWSRSLNVNTSQPRSIRSLHGEHKAVALVDLADREGFDLAASTAYSDSHTDLPFLEAVGNPVAVNPDRELARIADERGWEVLTFSERLHPTVSRRVSPVVVALPLAVGAAIWAVRRRAA